MISAEYIAGQQGWCYLTRWQAGTADGPLLLMLQPFAEEANRSRRLYSALAQRLATKGWTCYLPDLYGTGDSNGDFAEIDFEIWQTDLVRWISEWTATARPLHILACRFAAMQLVDLIPKLPENIIINSILLWQPQLDPRRFWQQLFRQELASQWLNDTTALSAAERLQQGQAVDIGGYVIQPALYQQINSLRIALNHLASYRLGWFELSAMPAISPAVQQQWQKLANPASGSHLQLLQQPAFYLQQEPLDNLDLLQKSEQFLCWQPEYIV